MKRNNPLCRLPEFLTIQPTTMMRRLTLLAVMLLFTASLSHAQKQYDELEFPELNEFNEPDVTTFTTPNGIKFYLVEDKELPLIDVSVDIRTGGVLVPNEKTGLASLTGQVIRSGGSSRYPADTLNALLENKAANMSTYIGFTQGGASLSVLKEDFDALLPVFIDVLTKPAFPQDKVDLAKTQAQSAISRRNDNAASIAGREYEQLIYGEDSKYGRTTEYATIGNITREDMVEFHQQHFNGNNMMVGVVGDFNANAMKQKLQEAFGSVPAGEATELAFPEVDYDYPETVNLADKPDVNQSTVYLGHVGGLRSNPDYAKVQVMNNVLSGGFSGRLFQKVRTDLGLAYSVGGQYQMNPFYPGEFYVQVQTKTETTAEAIDAIIGEIERLQNEPITEEELQDTKDQFLNSLVFRNTSYEQILNRRMSNDYQGLPEDSFDQLVEGVKNTTVEDVQQMAQKYLHPDSLQILVVGNKEGLGDQLQKYGQVNELDISIPQPGDDEPQKEVKGDAEKGRALLDQMADAIIEPGTELKSLSASGEISISMGMQSQKFPSTMEVVYPDAVTQTVQTPQGNLTMALKDGQATMTMAGQERTLPAGSQQAEGLKSTLNRSILAIAKKADELDPQFMGTEERDGTTYNKVAVNVADKNVTLFLDQQTHLPAMMEYQEFNPQQGGQITLTEKYADWTSGGGVTYPYKQTTMADGQQVAEAVFTEHQVNAAGNE